MDPGLRDPVLRHGVEEGQPHLPVGVLVNDPGAEPACRDGDPQLLPALPPEGFGKGLPRLLLAPGELPQPGAAAGAPALPDEDLSLFFDDCGGDFDHDRLLS